MAGFSNDVMYANNVRFDGAKFPGQVTADGQLLIGNAVFPNIRVGTITSPAGTITIGYSAPDITIDLAGGSTAIDSITVDAFTAPGTNPVVPDGTGLMVFTGAQAAAGTISTSIRTDSLAVNTVTIEVQRSSAQAVSSVAQNGVCHFDSADFTVDANGFVQALGGTSPWLDIAPPSAVVINTGYFATGAGALTLPLAPAQGSIIEIVDVFGGGVVVTASGAEFIQIQNTTSSAGGTATSIQLGDALRLVYRAADTTWYQAPGAGGNWVLA